LQALAQKAYGNVQQRTAGEEEIEIVIIKQITAELESVDAADDPSLALIADAVSRNLRMWTIFATDLASDLNGLPAEARATLISIAGFVHRESMKIFAGAGSIPDLIEVNRNLLVSLGGSSTISEGAV